MVYLRVLRRIRSTPCHLGKEWSGTIHPSRGKHLLWHSSAGKVATKRLAMSSHTGHATRNERSICPIGSRSRGKAPLLA